VISDLPQLLARAQLHIEQRGRRSKGENMPQYQMPVPTRQQRQQLRDRNKVPQGAAKVSIGDDIEAMRKTFGLSTMSKHQAATAQLLKDLDLYIATVKKKYPAFEQIVTKELKRKAEGHKRFVDDQLKAKTEFYPRYSAVQEPYKQHSLRGIGKPKDVAKAMERLLGFAAAFAMVDPKVWDPKRQGLNRLMSQFDRADALTQGHPEVFEKTDDRPQALRPGKQTHRVAGHGTGPGKPGRSISDREIR
jgi:hypothetical protein